MTFTVEIPEPLMDKLNAIARYNRQSPEAAIVELITCAPWRHLDFNDQSPIRRLVGIGREEDLDEDDPDVATEIALAEIDEMNRYKRGTIYNHNKCICE